MGLGSGYKSPTEASLGTRWVEKGGSSRQVSKVYRAFKGTPQLKKSNRKQGGVDRLQAGRQEGNRRAAV